MEGSVPPPGRGHLGNPRWHRLVVLALAVIAGPVSAEAQDVTPNIYNGTPTHDFPAVVGVGLVNRNGTQAICSGTLFAPSAVLTAGHCLAFDPVAGIAAVFPDPTTPTTRQDYVAAAFIRHPQFSLGRPAVADIGIMLLATPVIDVAPMPLAGR